MRRLSLLGLAISVSIALLLSSGVQTAAPQNPTATAPAGPRAVVDKYCIGCHNQRARVAGLALDTIDASNPSANAEVWEKVITKLRAGSTWAVLGS